MAKGKHARRATCQAKKDAADAVARAKDGLTVLRAENAELRRQLRSQDALIAEIARLRQQTEENTSDSLERMAKERDRHVENVRRLEDVLVVRDKTFDAVFKRLAAHVGGGTEALDEWLSELKGENVQVMLHGARGPTSGPYARAIERRHRMAARRLINESARPR